MTSTARTFGPQDDNQQDSPQHDEGSLFESGQDEGSLFVSTVGGDQSAAWQDHGGQHLGKPEPTQPEPAKSRARTRRAGRVPLTGGRRRLSLSIAFAVVAVVVALVVSVGARDAVRDLLVTGWGLPLGGDSSTEAAPSTSTTPSQAEAQGKAKPADSDPSGTASMLHWAPVAGASWQWLPTGVPDLTHPVDVYDLPLSSTTPDTVAAIHNAGAHAVCWIPVGIVSVNSPAAGTLDPALLGRAVDGHPDERYLDVRQPAKLRSFISAQLDECWTKGFDGVDTAGLDTFFAPGPDAVGFPITQASAQALVRLVAQLGHGRGLAVGLHVGPAASARADFVTGLESVTDFAVADRCVSGGLTCASFVRYAEHGKAVLDVEYLADYSGATAAAPQPALTRLCATTGPLGVSAVLKDGSGRSPSWSATCP